MDTVKLFIWNENDGTCIQWEDKDIIFENHWFFIFGKWGGGYLPFGLKDPKQWAEDAQQRVKEKFNYEVEIIWNKPL